MVADALVREGGRGREGTGESPHGLGSARGGVSTAHLCTDDLLSVGALPRRTPKHPWSAKVATRPAATKSPDVLEAAEQLEKPR